MNKNNVWNYQWNFLDHKLNFVPKVNKIIAQEEEQGLLVLIDNIYTLFMFDVCVSVYGHNLSLNFREINLILIVYFS